MTRAGRRGYGMGHGGNGMSMSSAGSCAMRVSELGKEDLCKNDVQCGKALEVTEKALFI